ncbi:MAG: type II toxin-antitoxin system VapB family antitoxin [Luteolibacter sp.]|jgi:Arc/MetJ family transcription regulator
MRTTVTLDDALIAEAMESSGISEKSRLINHALRELVSREKAARFLALEGTMPELEYHERGQRAGRFPVAIPMLNDSND